jgi:adenylate cyclase
MAEVFISYASATKAEAERVAGAIRALGYSVWRDDELPPHRTYSEVIEERLRAAKAVVVVWSKAAAASQWVRAEADLARQEGKLVQVVVDGSLPPMPFNQIQCADLTGWKGEAGHPQWRKVAASLAELLEAQDRAPGAMGVVKPRRTPVWAWALAGLAVLALAGAGLWTVRDRLPFAPKPAAVRVAVLPFETVGGGTEMQGFADGLLDETLQALTADRVQALSRTDSLALRGSQADQAIRRLDIGLFLDGTVRREGDVIKVRVSLNDARDHTTLWSADFERTAGEADALQAQVAARAADCAHWALVGRTKGRLDSATLAAFVNGADAFTQSGQGIDPLMRQVIAKAPNFAPAHSMLAMHMEKTRPDETISELTAAKLAEAHKALKLDPQDGQAYLLFHAVLPYGAWRERQDMLTKGIAADPELPYLRHFQNRLLAQVGRNKEAVDEAQRTAALNFMFIGGGTDLCLRLSTAGRAEEARPVCERADRLWPGEDFNDVNQFYLQVGDGRNAEALARLSHADLKAEFGADGPQLWTRFLQARLAGDAKAAAAVAQAMAKSADAGRLDPRHALIALSLTGQTDAAFDQALRFFTPARMIHGMTGDYLETLVLFAPSTAAMRRDPRFMTLAGQMGLVDFWRASGIWPDFCGEPGLPYDCKAQAAKVKAVRIAAPKIA